MNRFGMVLVLLAAFTLTSQTSVFAQGPLLPNSNSKIRWTESIQTAMKQQKDTGRPLLIYVTADYCGYCRKMERETWSDPKVARRIQDGFVALKVDAEKHEELVTRLEVKGLPATLLFDSEGQLIQTLSGYSRPSAIIELLDSVPAVAPASSGTVVTPK
jgi:thiol:disulfide interchange protein